MKKELESIIIKRLQYHCWNEGKKLNKNQIKNLMYKIIEKIGEPDKCFFDDKFCKYDFPNRKIQVELGHIKPFSKGGTITDPNNIIWICRRHNWMMSDRDLRTLKKMIDSILKIKK